MTPGYHPGYLSVCSGIEAVSVAWRGLPLRPVMFCEIEPFPRAVLAARQAAACMRFARPPDAVPLWPDFTALRVRHMPRLGIDPASIDILIGGTPCQAFSLAGRRRGLADARGNLSLAFVGLADAIDNFRRDRGLGPIVVGWENVEGVLSMPDNAFGCFLAALAGAGAPLVPPGRGRWSDAGLVVGPRRAAAWRLLDAQYFGLAQRRRRVLVVASARKRCPAEILFESEGVRRDSPPRRGAWHNLSGTLTGGARGRGGYSHDDGELIVAIGAYGGNRQSGPLDIAAALTANGQRMDFETETFVAHTLPSEGFDASEDGTGRGSPIVPAVLPFDCKRGGGGGGDVSGTLRAMSHAGSHANAGGHAAVAVASDAGDIGVRRLTPREWERLQGFPDDYTLIDYRGKPAADGPRYRALGNSMPVPMIRWLGCRIASVLGAI